MKALLLGLALMAPGWLLAQEAANPHRPEQGISIIGNRELPKVLHLVPWKTPQAAVKGTEIVPELSDVVSPIDRDVFARQVDYWQQRQALTPTASESEEK